MADYLISQHLYKYDLKFAVLLLQLCGGKLLFFVSSDLEVRRIMSTPPDLACCKSKSPTICLHTWLELQTMGMSSFMHLSQTSSNVFCIECNKQKLGWRPNTARLLDNVSYAAAFWLHVILFHSHFNHPYSIM